MIELTLLNAFRCRKNFESFRHLVNPKTLSKQSTVLLKDFNCYFKLFPSIDLIDLGVFKSFFFNERNPYLDDKSVLEYTEIFSRVEEQEKDKTPIDQLLISFARQELYRDIGRQLDSGVAIEELKDQIEGFITQTSKNLQDADPKMDLREALVFTDRSNGLQWRCKALRDHFDGGLIQGDFGILAGYVDSGKSSFIASEISHMAEQLSGDDYILWMSNEGDWKSQLPRLYCSTLNCTNQDLREYEKDAIIRYTQKMKGCDNRIIIKDIQGWSTRDIEKRLKKRPPKLLIIDLLDHVKGFDGFNSKESGSFEVYNKLYQWAREMATRYCPVLGVSQLNGDGENNMYPDMSKLRGSRVDKQAAATFQLVIGSITTDNSFRYLSMPKNKINSNKNWKVQVRFDPIRCRFD